MSKYDYLIVGAGFAGSVMAERLASQQRKKILIVEKRNHIGGNAYDEYDEYGIMVHRYGPHIFHTNSREVFEYLSKFTEWISYEHRVLAFHNNKLYPMPINRETINKLYGKHFKIEAEVKEFYERVKEKRTPILNSEDIIVNQVGYDLFEKFFKHYTKKQWGVEPYQLASSVCGRIRIKYDNDDRSFTDKYQFIPKHGYTELFKRMLDHPRIDIKLEVDYKNLIGKINYDKVIYTGPIDYYFDYKYGKLPYRSAEFKFSNIDQTDFQQTATINYVDNSVKFTRITEFKKITGQIDHSTSLCHEYPCTEGEPLFPIPTIENKRRYQLYAYAARELKDVLFVGRLANYQYYEMGQVIANCLSLLKKIHL